LKSTCFGDANTPGSAARPAQPALFLNTFHLNTEAVAAKAKHNALQHSNFRCHRALNYQGH